MRSRPSLFRLVVSLSLLVSTAACSSDEPAEETEGEAAAATPAPAPPSGSSDAGTTTSPPPTEITTDEGVQAELDRIGRESAAEAARIEAQGREAEARNEKELLAELEKFKVDEGAAAEVAVEEPASAAAEGDACARYERCCSDYYDAVSRVAGMADMAESGKGSCSADDYASAGDSACQTLLDSLKAASAAFEESPGFTMPGSCK